MREDKIRLGGMALANGVLVHGPTAWACAIRTPEGELKVESATKSFRAAEVEQPFLRGPARLAEVMLLLPQVRRALPEARLPFERPRVLATMLGSAVAARFVKTSRLKPLAQELLAGALSLARHGAVQLDGPQPGPRALSRAREAGPRAAAPAGDRGSEPRAARGRRGRARRLLGAGTWSCASELGGLGGTSLVVGARCSFGGKDAGSVNSQSYWRD